MISAGVPTDMKDDDVRNTVKVFDESGGWKDFFPLPVLIADHCQVTVGDNVYIIGGVQANLDYLDNSYESDEVDDIISSTVYVSRNKQDWTELGFQLRTKIRTQHACAVLNGRIYVIGGKDIRGNGEKLSSVEIFDPAHPSQWTYGPELPMPSSKGQAVVHEGVIYALAPEDGRGITTTRVFSLEEGAKEWKTVTNLTLERSDKRRVFPAPVVKSSVLHCNN